MPEQTGCEAERGRLASVARLFPRAAQGPQRVVLDRGDIDRREVPCAHQARQGAGITTLRFATVAGLLREQGRGNDPAAVAFLGQRAREPIAAGAGFRDNDALRALGLQWPEERVDITRPGPDRPQRDDFRAICLGDRGDRDGLLYGPPSRWRVCETAPWVTSERGGLMVGQQGALTLGSSPAFATGGNLPPSEVIMARCLLIHTLSYMHIASRCFVCLLSTFPPKILLKLFTQSRKSALPLPQRGNPD